VLEARGIIHAYSGKSALDGVDFTLRAGEVHALMGQNGAGKSTLIKVLTGAEPLQHGSITLNGARIAPGSTREAQQLGISTVYQEVNLCANLSVAENIFAGRQPMNPWTRGGGIDWKSLNARRRPCSRTRRRRHRRDAASWAVVPSPPADGGPRAPSTSRRAC
jgi:simple sugar transport system ATP-binding protein